MTKQNASRIYLITPRGSDATAQARLVRAPNSAQALNHVADEFDVKLAGQDDLVTLTAAGVKVEDARAKEVTA